MQWFRCVSHPYVIPGADEDRSSLMVQRRCDVPNDVHVPKKIESSSGVRVSNFIYVIIRKLYYILTSCYDGCRVY